MEPNSSIASKVKIGFKFSSNSCSIEFGSTSHSSKILTSNSSRYSSKTSKITSASSSSGKTLLLSSVWKFNPASSKIPNIFSGVRVYKACLIKFLFLS